MVCGGTGVTPMYQALHKLVYAEGETTDVRVLYGNRAPADVLLHAAL